MSSAVIYLNRGTRCYIRLVCSVFSLRKHYRGKVRVLQEGKPNPEFAALLDAHDVELNQIPVTNDHSFVAKASTWRHLIDDCSMFLDADTIVRKPVDQFLDWIKEHGLVTTWFHHWPTNRGPVAKRLSSWKKVVPPEQFEAALNFGKGINSGTLGMRRGFPMLEEYEKLTRRGYEAGVTMLGLDEIPLQLLLPENHHYMSDGTWNTSGMFGNVDQARIVHYHGSRHCRLDNPHRWLWQQTYDEVVEAFPQYFEFLSQAWRDKALVEYQLEKFGRTPTKS